MGRTPVRTSKSRKSAITTTRRRAPGQTLSRPRPATLDSLEISEDHMDKSSAGARNSMTLWGYCPLRLSVVARSVLLSAVLALSAPPTPPPATAKLTDDATAIKEAAKVMYLW